jgi:hypothetical protein
MIVYRVLAFCLWFGAMFAIITVLIAVALVFVIGATIVGLVSPTRTPKSTLQALAANTGHGIAQINALREASVSSPRS